MKLLAALLFLSGSPTLAASCCGGSFSFPALILGDDRAQITGTLSQSEITDDVLASGKWIRRKDDNRAQMIKLEGAVLFSDSLQGGFSLPMHSKNSSTSNTSSGLGDVSLYLGHETFPELTYSVWKPRGVTFLQMTAPTSPSIYDSALNASDIRGRGFYSLGAGLALIKAWKVWDFNFSSEIHKSFARTASGEAYNGEATIRPGWGTTQSLGLGWNRGDFRLGSSLAFLYEEPIAISGSTSSNGHAQKNFTLSIAGSYMINLESAVTVSYADQSLIGNPVNSSLSNTINLSYQQRWPR
ncbi:serine protease spb1 [Bdellovibrio bacteriovorus]|uniref:serine protease spb1 n=1 Tax=Bdellovibrio bacteriovorus TaxID=959 RepID=UPI003D08B8DC